MSESHAGLWARAGAVILSLTGLAWIALECRFNLLAVLGMVPCLLGLALVVAPAWCGMAGRQAGGAIWLPEGATAPRAPLSALDGRIVAERWEEAEEQARALCRRYPGDPEVWMRRLRLAWREPVDLGRAQAAHRAALAGMTDQGGRDVINRFYLLFAESRIADGEQLAGERAAFARRCAWAEAVGARGRRQGRWRRICSKP